MNDDDGPCDEVGDAAGRRDHRDRLRDGHRDHRQARLAHRGQRRERQGEDRPREDHRDASRDGQHQARRDGARWEQGRARPCREEAESACPNPKGVDREVAESACPKVKGARRDEAEPARPTRPDAAAPQERGLRAQAWAARLAPGRQERSPEPRLAVPARPGPQARGAWPGARCHWR